MGNLQLPGNPRYQPKELFTIFGYDVLYREVAKVEIATMQTLADIGVIPPDDIAELTSETIQELEAIRTTEVVEMERITNHDIRAWVELARAKMGTKIRRWLHIPLTSYDVLDTARVLQFKRAHAMVVSLTKSAIDVFTRKIQPYISCVQIGRTHGQHALPITVGFWLATILNRLVENLKAANLAEKNLVGKISGAVGAYNAQVALGIEARCGQKTFEERVLEKLGLKPARISTQILPPEPIADLLFAYVKMSATLGQFGLDCRNLMRTEISEIQEPFAKGQVGSSTMAHKRNPITYENLEGQWKKNKIEFQKVMECMTSEHQRDLVGSSIMRDFPVIVVNLVTQLSSILRVKDDKTFLARIPINAEKCEENALRQGDEIMAEPIYISLQMAGYEGNAHEFVNHTALPYTRENSCSLWGAATSCLKKELGDEEANKILNNIPSTIYRVFEDPRRYIGKATEKTVEILVEADALLQN